MSNWTETGEPWVPEPPVDRYGEPGDTVWNRPDRGDTELYRLVRARVDEAEARLDATVEKLRGES